MRKTHLLSIFFLQDKTFTRLLQFVQNGGDAEFFKTNKTSFYLFLECVLPQRKRKKSTPSLVSPSF